jgi:hypothetical protein
MTPDERRALRRPPRPGHEHGHARGDTVGPGCVYERKFAMMPYHRFDEAMSITGARNVMDDDC